MLEVYVCTKLSEPEINARRYRRGMTVSDLKNKLEMITGRSAITMMLSVYDKDKMVAKLDDDDSQLGSYPVENGMFLLVDDPAYQTLDEDGIDGYKMTDEEYNAKQVCTTMNSELMFVKSDIYIYMFFFSIGNIEDLFEKSQIGQVKSGIH